MRPGPGGSAHRRRSSGPSGRRPRRRGRGRTPRRSGAVPGRRPPRGVGHGQVVQATVRALGAPGATAVAGDAGGRGVARSGQGLLRQSGTGVVGECVRSRAEVEPARLLRSPVGEQVGRGGALRGGSRGGGPGSRAGAQDEGTGPEQECGRGHGHGRPDADTSGGWGSGGHGGTSSVGEALGVAVSPPPDADPPGAIPGRAPVAGRRRWRGWARPAWRGCWTRGRWPSWRR